MDVFDPDGKVVPHYSRNITAVADKAEGTIPLAMNDKTGTWRIVVKDLTSGLASEASCEVR